MFINCETPPDFVVNLAAISVNIQLGVFLKLSSTTEAINTHCKVPVACWFTAVVVFSKCDAPLLEHIQPILPVGSAVSLAFGSWLPVVGEKVLESGVCTCPGLLDEEV